MNDHEQGYPVMNEPCTREDPDIFFSTDPVTQMYAKSICAGCPFREPCSELGRREVHGVWGGELRGRTRSKNVTEKMKCGWCSEPFSTEQAKYCSRSCQEKGRRRERKEQAGQRRTAA